MRDEGSFDDNILVAPLQSSHQCIRVHEPASIDTSRVEHLWGNLLPELIEKILAHVSYLDSRCIGHIIPSWHPTIRAIPKPLGTWCHDSPCLLSFSDDYKTCTLTDPMRNITHLVHSPGIPSKVKILSSKHGWLLLMAADNRVVFFYNPLSKAIIHLPPYNFRNHLSFSFSAPPTSPGCIVLAERFFPCYKKVVICCRGDKEWRDLEDEFEEYYEGFETRYTTAVFLRERFYLLGHDGRIGVFDPATISWAVHGKPKHVWPPTHRHYLVESDGDIFWINATKEGDSVRIYKLNHSNYVWEKTERLGDRCFFLWRSSSIGSSELAFAGLKERIYFPMLKHDCIVYFSCEKHEMFPAGNFYGAEELSLGACWIEPCWVQPTVQELQWF